MENVKKVNEYIREKLFEFQDTEYREFHSKLMPEFDKSKVIGVRTPILKSFAKQIFTRSDKREFLDNLPHEYYEENNLHSFIISQEKDFDRAILEVENFLPFVNNWATCDGLDNVSFEANKEKLLPYVLRWIESSKTYTIRFGILTFMKRFLGKDFKTLYAERIAKISSQEYYVKMMIAWYFATALAKNYDEVLPFIENKILPKWTHNKAIQKAVESFRISSSQKEYLRTLKIK